MSPADTSALLRWAEVDAGVLRDNAAAVRSFIGPGVHLLAMVKSDAYGHGATLTARAALDGGATWLGVYTPDEAVDLRAAGFTEPLLVAGWSPPATHRDLVERGVDVTVFDASTLRSLAAVAEDGRARVHVKLDTGLNRLGVREEALPEFAGALRAAGDRVEVVGIFTHFADAEKDPAFTAEQHRRFIALVGELRSMAPDALLHATGSAAILNFPEMHHDMVRLGIALYGYPPHESRPDVGLRVAMSVLARVVQVKSVDAGESVGYGRTWWASARRRIATVAFGYSQGLPRALSNRGHVVVRGRRCGIAGTVNMDQITVDVSDVEHVAVGDVAMVFGERDGVRLGADELAAMTGTIPHEILCRVSAQVPRVAVGS